MVARVALLTRTRFQCSQTLKEGGYNDTRIAMTRIAFSAVLLSASSRPSVTNRVSAWRRAIV